MPKADEPEMTREEAKKEKADHAKAKKDLAAAVKALKAAKKSKDATKIQSAREELEETLVTHHRHLSLLESAAGRKHLKGGTRRRHRSRRHTMRY
jgi:cellobiose-specific phosphotransferase system component IIA